MSSVKDENSVYLSSPLFSIQNYDISILIEYKMTLSLPSIQKHLTSKSDNQHSTLQGKQPLYMGATHGIFNEKREKRAEKKTIISAGYPVPLNRFFNEWGTNE